MTKEFGISGVDPSVHDIRESVICLTGHYKEPNTYSHLVLYPLTLRPNTVVSKINVLLAKTEEELCHSHTYLIIRHFYGQYENTN
jgi:hypothetical protein